MSSKHTRRIIRDMRRNGYDLNEDTAALNPEDLASELRPATLRDIEAGWRVKIRMDSWTVRQLYGYCSD